MADAPGAKKTSTRPYIVLRSRFDDGVYEYVATFEAGDPDRAIKQARATLAATQSDISSVMQTSVSERVLLLATYRDEWHAIPERNWTTLAAAEEETVKTLWSPGHLPGAVVSTKDSRPLALEPSEDES